METAIYDTRKATLTYWTARYISTEDGGTRLSAPFMISTTAYVTLAEARRILAEDMVRTEIVQLLEIRPKPPKPPKAKPPLEPKPLWTY